MTNPALNWLRDVALEVIRAKNTDCWLRTGRIVELIADTEINVPGLPEHGDITDDETRKRARQATGLKLHTCFRSGDVLNMDGMSIERQETYDQESRYTVREYRFMPAAKESVGLAAEPSDALKKDNEQTPDQTQGQAELPVCGYAAASRAASRAADKTPAAANADDPSRIGQSLGPNSKEEHPYISTMEPLSRIAAEPGKTHAVKRDDEGEI